MISDLSKAQNAMPAQLPLGLTAAEVGFDRPVESFNPSSPKGHVTADVKGVISMAHLGHAARQEYETVGKDWTPLEPAAPRMQEA
jgi:hypothetical protein